jgi:hypothetical protein
MLLNTLEKSSLGSDPGDTMEGDIPSFSLIWSVVISRNGYNLEYRASAFVRTRFLRVSFFR